MSVVYKTFCMCDRCGAKADSLYGRLKWISNLYMIHRDSERHLCDECKKDFFRFMEEKKHERDAAGKEQA